MKIKKFSQLNESDGFIEYTTEDSIKLLSNIVNEWEQGKYKSLVREKEAFQKGRILGAIETILTLNGKLQGGKPYEYEKGGENFEQMMVRMAKELIDE
jgi:hypothetical protein